MKFIDRLFNNNNDPVKNPNKSFFDLSTEWQHDFTLGRLIPCMNEPTMPGDEFDISLDFMFKFDPLYYPVIHMFKMHCDIVWVPYKMMWKEQVAHEPGSKTGWINWIMQNSTELHPTVDVDMEYIPSSTANDSVMGYFGIPYLYQSTSDPGSRSKIISGLNAFAPMAYLHYWDWYQRNDQLEDERRFNLASGDNTAAFVEAFAFDGAATDVKLSVFPAKWGKDLFTSATPRPEILHDLTLPLLDGNGFDLHGENNHDVSKYPSNWYKPDGSPVAEDGYLIIGPDGQTEDGANPGARIGLDITEHAASVHQLDIVVKLQRLRERAMRVGKQYTDWVMGFFGNNPAPGEVIKPVMIGSYMGRVQVSEVMTQANTTVGESEYFTGDYTGNASLYEQAQGSFKFTTPDYGIIIAVMTVVPNTRYGQGIGRWWRYSNPTDYPIDMLCGVGDQEIKKEEVLYNNVVADVDRNQETFGYTGRYNEARTGVSNYGTNMAWGVGLSTHAGRYWDVSTLSGNSYSNAIEINARFTQANDIQGGTRVGDVFKALTAPTGLSLSNPITGYVARNVFVRRNLPVQSIADIGL